jgi:hypothetical protein
MGTNSQELAVWTVLHGFNPFLGMLEFGNNFGVIFVVKD